jgi:hypothetical protein
LETVTLRCRFCGLFDDPPELPTEPTEFMPAPEAPESEAESDPSIDEAPDAEVENEEEERLERELDDLRFLVLR